MKRISSLYLVLVLTCSLWAQEAHEIARKYAKTITANDFKAHLTFLADDLLEGRETGERGQIMAAHYIRTHFMRVGLAPGLTENNSYYQEYFIRKTQIKEASIKIGKKSFAFGEGFFSTNLPKDLEGEWVFGGYGISQKSYDNLEGLEVQNKNVIIFAGSPEEDSEVSMSVVREWRSRADIFEEKGTKNLLMILPDDWFQRMSRFARRQSLSTSNDDSRLSILYISEDLAKALLAKAKTNPLKLKNAINNNAIVPKLSFKKMQLQYQANVDRNELIPTNVLGFLEGRDKKEEIIVITAHYDHIGINRRGVINNGADDDGSGTTAVLELAEAFALAAKDGHRPRRSILFMTVSGEEKGLLGSAYYTAHPVYPLENTIANLNIDMIGRIDPTYEKRADSTNYIYLIGSDKLSTDLHEIGEWANDTFTQLTLDYTYNDENDPNRFYYRSDHYNFAKHGVPVIFYFNGTHKDYHRPTDDVDKIKFDKAAKVTRLIFHTAWELANRAERIKVDTR